VEVEDEEESYNEKETQGVGKVRMNVYKNYIKSVQNIPLVIFVIFLRVLNQAIASFIDYFVAQWVNWEESLATNSSESSIAIANDTLKFEKIVNILNNDTVDVDDIEQRRQQWINIYIAVICTFIVVILKAEFSFFYSLLRASKNLHNMMFNGLVNTYQQFFNQNPSGRILNRFSKDIGNIDTILPNCLFECTCVSF
jgi:ABC-type multidrug transport system fused ATPase/permease subunit